MSLSAVSSPPPSSPQVLHRRHAPQRDDVRPFARALRRRRGGPGPPEDRSHRCAPGSAEGHRPAEAGAPRGPPHSCWTRAQTAGTLHRVSGASDPPGEPGRRGGGAQQHRRRLLLLSSAPGAGDPLLWRGRRRVCVSGDDAGRKKDIRTS